MHHPVFIWYVSEWIPFNSWFLFWSDALNAFLFGHGPMAPTQEYIFLRYSECCTRGSLPRVFWGLPRVHLALREAGVSRSVGWGRGRSEKSHNQSNVSYLREGFFLCKMRGNSYLRIAGYCSIPCSSPTCTCGDEAKACLIRVFYDIVFLYLIQSFESQMMYFGYYIRY
jgi:hypothetical protein